MPEILRISELYGRSCEALLVVERRPMAVVTTTRIQTENLGPNLYLERDRFRVAATLKRMPAANGIIADRAALSTERRLGSNLDLASLLSGDESTVAINNGILLALSYSRSNNAASKVARLEAEHLKPLPHPLDRLMTVKLLLAYGANGEASKSIRASWAIDGTPELHRTGLSVSDANIALLAGVVAALHRRLVIS